jgi:hypothetical protein
MQSLLYRIDETTCDNWCRNAGHGKLDLDNKCKHYYNELRKWIILNNPDDMWYSDDPWTNWEKYGFRLEMSYPEVKTHYNQTYPEELGYISKRCQIYLEYAIEHFNYKLDDEVGYMACSSYPRNKSESISTLSKEIRLKVNEIIALSRELEIQCNPYEYFRNGGVYVSTASIVIPYGTYFGDKDDANIDEEECEYGSGYSPSCEKCFEWSVTDDVGRHIKAYTDNKGNFICKSCAAPTTLTEAPTLTATKYFSMMNDYTCRICHKIFVIMDKNSGPASMINLTTYEIDYENDYENENDYDAPISNPWDGVIEANGDSS